MTLASPIITVREGGVRVTIHAQPGAKSTEVVGVHGDALKVRVQAPPVDGRANEELLVFFAALFHIARSRVRLVRGETARRKIFDIDGVSLEQAKKILLA